jgi:hypothetical protein
MIHGTVRLYIVSHFLFYQEISDNMTVVCHPSYLPGLALCDFSVSSIEDKTEVTEAESQMVLNTLTDHNFQDAFKKWLMCGRGLLRG